jgi:hypothetical protein
MRKRPAPGGGELSERQIVVVRRRGLIERRAVPGRRRLARDGSRASRDWWRIGARGAVAGWPDHPFAPWTATFARLVPAFEVGCSWIALRRAVVPHRPTTDRAEGHAVLVQRRLRRAPGRSPRGRRARRRGWGCCARLPATRRTARCRARSGSGRRARGPDHPATRGVLALEVRSLRIPLPLPVVPHRSLALGTARDRRFGVGRTGLAHRDCGWETVKSSRGCCCRTPTDIRFLDPNKSRTTATLSGWMTR